MCGICGLVSLDGASAPDRDLLARMNATLRHRGPDSEGLTVDGPVGLAMRRLSIIDLIGGDQPISSEDGNVVVVCNGEIYNYRELREELEGAGHRFATDSDSEVVVHLYEERGPGFLELLRGMFGLALWDRSRERLLCARDQFGIKPLYWRSVGGTLAFGSELKALMAMPDCSREIDPDALEAYLAFNTIPAPMTIYRDCRKLPAGHSLIWEGGEVRIERYLQPLPEAAEGLRGESEEVLATELRERLADSVRAHLIADVPVGVLLSGGVDSCSLAALAATESSERIKTFSIGFTEDEFNETARARLVAERYDTDHHELVVRPDAVELLPEIVRTFDEPFADSSALPTYLVSELAAGSVKVALSGEGADELFGGYYTYVADLWAPHLAPFARAGRPLIERLPSSSGKVSFDYKAKRFAAAAHLPPLERHHGWKEIFSASDRAELLRGDLPAAADPLDGWRKLYAETEGAERLARLQDLDLRGYLPDDLLVKTDRASMAHSLETRVPFLDPVVAELALALPRRAKVRGNAKKRILRRAMASLLPREITHGKKHGFSIPVAAWLRGELEPFAREVLSAEQIDRQGVFDPAAVTRRLDDHVAGRADLSRQLWGLLSFTLWHAQQTTAPTIQAASR